MNSNLISMLTKLFVSFVLNLVFLPIKIVHFLLAQILWRKNPMPLIIFDCKAVGHLFSNVFIWNQIEQRTIILVPHNFYLVAKKLVHNQNIVIQEIRNRDLFFVFKKKITRIIIAPLSSTYFSSTCFLASGLLVFFMVDLSDYKYWKKWMLFHRIITSIAIIFICQYWRPILFFRFEETLVKRLVTRYGRFLKASNFKTILNSNNSSTKTKLRGKNSRNIIINVQGSDAHRTLPFSIVEKVCATFPFHNIIFVGSSSSAQVTSHDYADKIAQKYPTVSVQNLVDKTSLLQLIDIVNDSHFVVSIETSIPHLCWILGKPCFVWLKNRCYSKSRLQFAAMKNEIMMWNWPSKDNCIYINSSFFEMQFGDRELTDTLNYDEERAFVNGLLLLK